MYFQFRYAASRRTAKANLPRDPLPERREALVEVPYRPHFALERSRRARRAAPTGGDVGDETIEADGPRRPPERPPAERLHEAGHRPDVRPLASCGRGCTRSPRGRARATRRVSDPTCGTAGRRAPAAAARAPPSRPCPTARRSRGRRATTVTGIVAYWPMTVVPSRASQMSGPSAGTFGLRRYCQSQRSRLASAVSGPNTRRYSASTCRRSSGR